MEGRRSGQRGDLDRAAHEAQASCLEFRGESAGHERTQPPAENSCGSSLSWSDSNVSRSGATLAGSPLQNPSREKLSVIFGCCFPAKLWSQRVFLDLEQEGGERGTLRASGIS